MKKSTGNLFDALLGVHLLNPDRRGSASISDRGTTWTFDELNRASARMAGYIQSRGLCKGDRLVVQAENSAQLLALYLGALRTGVVFVPIDPACAAAEAARILSEVEPALFVAARACIDTIQPLMPPYHIPALSLESDGTGEFSLQSTKTGPQDDVCETVESDLAVILYTSGATGRPRGAMLTHRNLAKAASSVGHRLGTQPGDVLLNGLPLSHPLGLLVATNSVMRAGAGMILMARFGVAEALASFPMATMFVGAPYMYAQLLAGDGLTRKTSVNARLFMSGSAPLLRSTVRAFEERTGCTIVDVYTLAETTVISISSPDDEHLPGGVGRPLADVEVRLADSHVRLSRRTTGELEVRGPHVFAGYWRMPQNTKDAMHVDGFFRTGDIARIDETGAMTLVGRLCETIVSGGWTIYPRELEDVLSEVPGICEAAVFGVPHPELKEGVIIILARHAGWSVPSEDEVTAIASRELRVPAVPLRIAFVEALPRSPAGQILKSDLRDAYRAVFATA